MLRNAIFEVGSGVIGSDKMVIVVGVDFFRLGRMMKAHGNCDVIPMHLLVLEIQHEAHLCHDITPNDGGVRNLLFAFVHMEG